MELVENDNNENKKATALTSGRFVFNLNLNHVKYITLKSNVNAKIRKRADFHKPAPTFNLTLKSFLNCTTKIQKYAYSANLFHYSLF